MPEGHTIHRLARKQQKLFGRRVVQVSSPQGRFAEGAAQLDGRVLEKTEAYGKHLLQYFSDEHCLHIHLGLYGKVTTGIGEPPEPRGALRLRMVNETNWADLRGPTACELIDRDGIARLLDRLGPDPLRADADADRAFRRVSRSRAPIAALLMDQAVIAGIGNVYRAELLFRHGLNPFMPGRDLPEARWRDLWTDLCALLRDGVRSGRIVTVRAEDRARTRGPLRRDEANYVYRRAGLPCRVCTTEVRTELLVGRNLFWCPTCQAPGFTALPSTGSAAIGVDMTEN